MCAMWDEGLADLVSAGGWLRGTEAASALIHASYSKESAEVLHQPDLAKHITGQLKRTKRSKLARKIADSLGEIQPLLSLDTGVTEYAVEKIHKTSADLVERIVANSE